MTRVGDYCKFITEQYNSPIIDEMAGKGKPGPMSKAEKDAAAVAAEEKAKKDAEYKAKMEAHHKHYNEVFAPKHLGAFAAEAMQKLSDLGFKRIHSSQKHDVYMRPHPKHDVVDIFSIMHPSMDLDKSFDAHTMKIKHVVSNGTSHSDLRYEPKRYHREFNDEADKEEAERRKTELNVIDDRLNGHYW